MLAGKPDGLALACETFRQKSVWLRERDLNLPPFGNSNRLVLLCCKKVPAHANRRAENASPLARRLRRVGNSKYSLRSVLLVMLLGDPYLGG